MYVKITPEDIQNASLDQPVSKNCPLAVAVKRLSIPNFQGVGYHTIVCSDYIYVSVDGKADKFTHTWDFTGKAEPIALRFKKIPRSTRSPGQ